LQRGGQVADIAVVYPIVALQAGYRFGVGNPYHGEPVPPEADYMAVGEILSLGLRRDFTFLHPEVLDAKCTVRGDLLSLENKLHPQQYRIVILPGGKTIAWKCLEKVQRFYQSGGRVIATTCLPQKSAEFGADAKVQAAVREMFGDGVSVRSNAAGGKAYFLAKPAEDALRRAIDDALTVPDVAIEGRPQLSGGNLSYLHKRDGPRDVYFFANSSDTPIETHVRLRGRHRLEAWDPHTGKIAPAEQADARVGAGSSGGLSQFSFDENGTVPFGSSSEVTRVRLVLPPVRSLFLVDQ
jgi:alpha-L-rhamnosidase